MTRIEFIKALFHLCGKRDETSDFILLYDRALTVPYKVNWEKFFDFVAFNLEKKTLPLPKYLREKIHQFRRVESIEIKNLKCPIRVFYSDGRFEDYVNVGYGSGISELIEKHREGHNVTKIILYPADTVFFGYNIYPEGTEGKIIYS